MARLGGATAADYLKTRRSMEVKVSSQFKDSDFERLLAPDADPSQLAGHVSSFGSTLRCIRDEVPLPYSHLVSAIPTLHAPSVSTTTTPSGRVRPAWCRHKVFAPHLNRYGQNVMCNPTDIWNPFEGPFDFSDTRFAQVRNHQVLFYFCAVEHELVAALHYHRFLEFNVVGSLADRVKLEFNILLPIERGCMTYFFLAARAMYSGDQRLVTHLQQVVSNFSLRPLNFNMSLARAQMSACLNALGPDNLPHDVLRLVLTRFNVELVSRPSLKESASAYLGNELTHPTIQGINVIRKFNLIFTKLEQLHIFGLQDGSLQSTSPAFYGDNTGPRSMTAADIAHEWTRLYNRAKGRAAKSDKSVPSTLALFRQSIKCHHCGKQGCFNRVCPAKLRGDPPIARPRPSPTHKPRQQPALLASADDLLTDDAEIDSALALLANSSQLESVDETQEEVVAGMIAHMDISELSPPALAPEDPSAFIGEPVSSARGQRDPAYQECYDDPAAFFAQVDSPDEDDDFLTHDTEPTVDGQPDFS